MHSPCTILGALALTLGLSACEVAPEPGPWQDGAGHRWRELAAAGSAATGFTALAPAVTGVSFNNTVSDSAALSNRHFMDGAGVAIGDVNGDGRPDLYLCRIEGPNALYLNEGNWRFREAALAAGVALGDRPSTGAVLADLDGDGDLDLVVTSMGGRNSLFRNDGSGRFGDATGESGFVAEGRGSTTATLADVEGDGDLDLYVANYKTRTMLDSLPPEQRRFEKIVERTATGFRVIPERRADYRLMERPELHSVTLVQRADPDWFYLNDGTGHFTREPLVRNPRFLDEDGRPLTEEPEDFGLAARFYDVTGDGAPDLYVANDFEDPDQFWINDGSGRFRLIAQQAVRRTSNSNMAVDFADIDRDGLVDLFQVDMLANDGRRRKTQAVTHTTFRKLVGDYTLRAQWQRNTLLLNRGDQSFAEIADFAGVAASGWSWSALFLDVDLDGFEDLLIGNGHTWDLMDVDAQERLRGGLGGGDWRLDRKSYPALLLENVAFRNRGDLSFEDASERWRFGTEADISHGMAAGDLDADGDLDVIVNRLNAPAAVLRNDAPAPRIAVRARGRAPNTHAVGARIRIVGGAVPEQEREVTAGGLYLSSSDASLSFATGTADSVAIEVRWRRGGITRIPNARAGRLYEVQEADSGNRIPEPGVGGPRSPGSDPLFQDVSGLLNAGHADSSYDDHERQPLLDFQLSQLGPGVTWADLDADGREDLVVPDGAGGELAWYRNEGRRFVRVPLGFPAGNLDFTMALPLAEPSGARSLLVGRSTYQAASLADALRLPGVARLTLARDGRTVVSAAALTEPDSASVGAMAMADIDSDGDLDLFVAGRVIPGAYPLAPSSRLYRNEGGSFVRDRSSDPAFERVGMTSAAVFTDINGDGWPDLALAIEWGPVKLFLNQRGRFAELTDRSGLAAYQGSWKGLTAGDFDGDGRMDLIGTNWGRNVTFGADSTTPLYLYAGRFGNRPRLDLVPAAEDSRLGAIAPLTAFARFTRALPELRSRVPSFAAYADAPLDRVLGGDFVPAQQLQLTTLNHTLWLNRGERFEARALPPVAQLAPAFGAVVADFDADGREDLFLAQNFSQTETGTPRFDAGRGLLLLGEGAGALRPVPGQHSGIVVYGDQRGAAAADFDGDGRTDLAVSQNAGATRLFRNAGSRSGLAVSLTGPPGNPASVGAVIRIRYTEGMGPAREIHAGSGYWSGDGTVQVLGRREGKTVQSVWIRWPGGRTTETPVPSGAQSIRIAP